MPLLELKNLSKTFDKVAVSNFSLRLNQGNILCLLGPSGCGKTTLLRLIAGLETPDQGDIFFEDRSVIDVPPHKRQFGMMFQELALFPHKSVLDNITFGLHLLKQTPDQIRERAEEMLELVGLADLSSRNVADLSGGERQRVALARSLAPRPKLLMLDEPLGALDRALRERLLLEIRSILKQLNVTAIFVTHDQTEAMNVADVIAVMNEGCLVQVDSPQELYLHPKHSFVAGFLGFQNLLSGTVLQDGRIETDIGILAVPPNELKEHEKVLLVVRPESGRIDDETEHSPRYQKIQGVVANRIFSGQIYRVKMVNAGKTSLTFDVPNTNPPPGIGEKMTVWIDTSCLTVIKEGILK